MAFRKIKAKKYNGISEYFNPKSADKETRALYIMYRDETGKPTLQKTDTLDRDEARKQLNTIKSEVTEKKQDLDGDVAKIKKAVATKSLTLQQASDMYFSKKRNKETVRVQSKMQKRVLDTKLGKKRIAKITTEDIQALQDSLADKLAPGTINRQLSDVRALFNTAIKNGWAKINPVIDITKLEEDTQPGRVMSDEELTRMFNVFQYGDYDLEILPNPTLFFFTKILLQTGARPAAVIDVQVKHCDLNQKKMRFKAMKKGKSYSQTLTPELAELVEIWIKKHNLKHNDFLFHSKTNKANAISDSSLRRIAQKAYDKLFNVGIPVKDVMHRVAFYSLRRTGGTMMYNKKGIIHAMVFLNHTSVKTTQRYLNVEGDIGEAVNDVF